MLPPGGRSWQWISLHCATQRNIYVVYGASLLLLSVSTPNVMLPNVAVSSVSCCILCIIMLNVVMLFVLNSFILTVIMLIDVRLVVVLSSVILVSAAAPLSLYRISPCGCKGWLCWRPLILFKSFCPASSLSISYFVLSHKRLQFGNSFSFSLTLQLSKLERLSLRKCEWFW